jgi:predicted ester cyclase
VGASNRNINASQAFFNRRRRAIYIKRANLIELFRAKEEMASSTSPEAHRALYVRYLAICNAHDFDGMEGFLTPDILINDQPSTPTAATAQFRELMTAFADWHWEIRHFGVDGDLLHLHFRVTGTHRGAFRGIEPTGRRIETQQFTLYRVVEGGRFGAVWDLTDFESVVRQLTL